MMNELIKLYKKTKGVLSQAEELYDLAQERGSNNPLEIILPLIYSQFANKEELIPDQRAVLFSGQYFASKYPHLRQYFIGEEQAMRQEQTSQELLGVLREHTRNPPQQTIKLLTNKRGER